MSNTTKKRALNNRSAKSRQHRKVKYTAGITGLGGVNGGNSQKNKGIEGIEGGVQQNKPSPIDEDKMHFEWHTDFTDKDTGQHFASGYAAAIIGPGGFVGYKALDEHRRAKQEAQNKQTQKAAEETAKKQEKKEPSKEDNLRRNYETIIPIGEGMINAYSRVAEHITKNGSTKGFEAQDAYERQAVADVQNFKSPQDAVAWLKEERNKTQGTLDSVKKQLAALGEKPEEKTAPAAAPQKKPEDAVEKKEPPKPVEKPAPKEKTIKERKPIAPWKARTDAPTPEQAARMKHVKNILGKEWAKVWRRVADLKEAGKTKEARRVLLTAGNRYFNYAKEAYERWGDGEALSAFGQPRALKESEQTGENIAESVRERVNALLNQVWKEKSPETIRKWADSRERKSSGLLAQETAAKETPVEEKPAPEAPAPDFNELDKQYDGLLASGALTENEADELAEIRDRANLTHSPEDVKAFADKIADIDAKNNPPVFGEEEQPKEPETPAPAPVEDKQIEEQQEETPQEDVKEEESDEVKKARAVLDAEIRVYDHLRDWGSLRGFIPQNDFEREICKQIAGLKKKKALERIAGDARYRKQIIENGGIPKEEAAETKSSEQAPQDAPVLEPGVSMNEIAERAAAVPDSDKFTATSPLGVKSYKEGYLDETFNDNVPEELRNDPEIQDAFRKAAAADVAALERNAGIEQDDKQHGAFNAEGDFTLPEEKKAVADFKRLVNKKAKTVSDSEITGGLDSIRRRREEARRELEELGGTPSPEGADAAEELRKFLGDYGINVDAPTVEEPKAEKAEETSVEEQAEEAPVVEETPDSENPRRKGRAISILGVDMSETPSEEIKSKYPQGAKLGENLRRGLYDVLGKDRIEAALTDMHSGDQNKISEFFQWASNIEQMDRRPYEQVRAYNAILSELEAAGMGVALASLPFTSKLFSPQSYIWTKAVQDAQAYWHGKGNVVAWDDNWVAEGTPEYDAISKDKEIRNLWAKAEDAAYNARRYDDETRAITRGYRERGEEDRAAEQRRLKSASTRAFNKLANAIADKYEEITSKKDDAPNVAEEPSPEVAETTPQEAPAPVESSDAPVVGVVGEPNSVVGAVVGENAETPETTAETPEEPSAEAAPDAPVVDTTDAPESDVANANEPADDISKRFEEELRNGKNARDMQDHLHYLGYKLRKQFQKEMRDDPVIQKAMLDYYDSPQSRIDAEILNRTVAARHSQWLKDRSVIKDQKPLPYSPDDIRKQIPEYYLNDPKQSESKKDYEERIKTEDKFNELISDSYGKTLWSQALKDYFESGYDGKQHLPVEIDVHAKGDPEIQKAFVEYVDKNGLKTWGEEWDSLQKLIKSKIEQFNAERNSNEQAPPEPPVIADEQTPVEKPAQNAPVANETPKQKKRAPRPTAAPPRKSDAHYLHKEDDPYYRNGGDKGYRWQPEKTYESTWEDFNNEGPDRLGWTNDEATGERDFENDGDLRAARKEVMRRLLNDLGIDYDSAILQAAPIQRGINEYVKDAYNRFGAAGLKGNLEDNEEFAKDYEKIRDFVAEYSDVLARHLHSINTDAFSVSPLNFRRQTAEQQRDTLERASKALDKILKTSKQKDSKTVPFNVEIEKAFAKELSAAVKALKKGEEKPTSEIASLYSKARKMFMGIAAKQAMTSEFFDDSLEDVNAPVWEKNLSSGKKDAPVLDFFEDQKPETSDDIADAVNENIPDEESQATADAPVLAEQAETVEEEPETETPVVEETGKEQQGPVRFEDVYKGGGFDEPDLHKAVASPNGVRFGDDRRGGVMRADVKNGKLYVAPEKAFNPEKAMFNDVKQQLEDAGGKWNAATKEWEFPLTNKVLMKIRESTPLRGTVGQLSYQSFVNTPGVSVDERESVDNLYNTPFTQSDYGSVGRLTPWKIFKSAMVAKPSEFKRGIEYDKEIVGAIQKLLTDGKAAAEGLKDDAAKEAAADAVKRFKAFVKARFEQWRGDQTIFAQGTPLDEALYEKYVKPFDEAKKRESAGVKEEPKQAPVMSDREFKDYFDDKYGKVELAFQTNSKDFDKYPRPLVDKEIQVGRMVARIKQMLASADYVIDDEDRHDFKFLTYDLERAREDCSRATQRERNKGLAPVSLINTFVNAQKLYNNILAKQPPQASADAPVLGQPESSTEEPPTAPEPVAASEPDAPVVSEEVAETEETPTGETETETVEETAEADAPVVEEPKTEEVAQEDEGDAPVMEETDPLQDALSVIEEVHKRAGKSNKPTGSYFAYGLADDYLDDNESEELGELEKKWSELNRKVNPSSADIVEKKEIGNRIDELMDFGRRKRANVFNVRIGSGKMPGYTDRYGREQPPTDDGGFILGDYIKKVAQKIGGDEFVNAALKDPFVLQTAEDVRDGSDPPIEAQDKSKDGSGHTVYTYNGETLTPRGAKTILLDALSKRYRQWKNDPMCGILGKPLSLDNSPKATSLSEPEDTELKEYLDQGDIESLPADRQKELAKKAFYYAASVADQAYQIAPDSKDVTDAIKRIASLQKKIKDIDYLSVYSSSSPFIANIFNTCRNCIYHARRIAEKAKNGEHFTTNKEWQETWEREAAKYDEPDAPVIDEPAPAEEGKKKDLELAEPEPEQASNAAPVEDDAPVIDKPAPESGDEYDEDDEEYDERYEGAPDWLVKEHKEALKRLKDSYLEFRMQLNDWRKLIDPRAALDVDIALDNSDFKQVGRKIKRIAKKYGEQLGDNFESAIDALIGDADALYNINADLKEARKGYPDGLYEESIELSDDNTPVPISKEERDEATRATLEQIETPLTREQEAQYNLTKALNKWAAENPDHPVLKDLAEKAQLYGNVGWSDVDIDSQYTGVPVSDDVKKALENAGYAIPKEPEPEPEPEPKPEPKSVEEPKQAPDAAPVEVDTATKKRMYKHMLDVGAITQDEYDKRMKELEPAPEPVEEPESVSEDAPVIDEDGAWESDEVKAAREAYEKIRDESRDLIKTGLQRWLTPYKTRRTFVADIMNAAKNGGSYPEFREIALQHGIPLDSELEEIQERVDRARDAYEESEMSIQLKDDDRARYEEIRRQKEANGEKRYRYARRSEDIYSVDAPVLTF